MRNQKGFIPVLLVIVLIAVLGISIFRSKNTPISKTDNTALVSQTPQSTPSLPPTNIVKLSDAWNLGIKTYSNPKISITFDYPSYFDVKEVDIQKENADWLAKYKNERNLRQPLYTSAFYVIFKSIPDNPSAGVTDEICNNKMSVDVQKNDNSQNLTLYDFIADLAKTYAPGGGLLGFEGYKKGLKTTSLPKEGSYEFKGIGGEKPVKIIYFENNGKIYSFGLTGNCYSDGEYSKDADKVFQNILKSIKYLSN